MNPKPQFYFLLFCLLIVVYPASSQEIIFNKVLPSDGKNFIHVTGITQDVNGYMWYATKKGLYRYDGYHMTSYKNNPLNPNSLMSNSLESIAADSNGMIWIGSLGKGIDRLDPVTGIFTHFPHDSNDLSSLSNDTVTVILVDNQGTLWIGNLGGLDQFDSKTNKFIHYRYDAKYSTSISNNQVRAIYEDRQGILWIGTGSPYPWDGGGPEAGGLNRMDKKTGTFTRYLHDPNNMHSLMNNKVSAIFEDSQGVLWIGTAGNGLHKMKRQQGNFERIIYEPAHPEKLSGPVLTNESPIYTHITFINQDAAGRFWIGSSDDGLNYFNPKIGKIIHYEETKNSSTEFNDNSAWCAFTSRDGILWIGTGRGNLYRIDPFQRNIPHYASPGSSRVESFMEEVGTLWIGTEEGLFRKDLATGTVKRYMHDPLNPASLGNNYIQYMFKDRQGNIWLATLGGLDFLNKDKETFTHYPHDPKNSNSISSNHIGFIYEDPQAKLWIVTSWGLNLMDRRTGTFTRYFFDPKDTRFGGDNITYVLKDSQGKLWVGSWGGLHLLNPQNGKFNDYLKYKSIFSICEDAQGDLWVGTNDGLYLYSRTSDAFSLFVDPGSLTNIPDVISIAEDNQKNLWICGSNGLVMLNPQRNNTSVYGLNYGVKGVDFELTYCHKGLQGRLYFSDQTGYFAFYPEQLSRNAKPPEIVLTSFRLGDQVVAPAKEGPLTEPLLTAKEIRLHHDQNIFSFYFTAFHYSNPQSNLHLFKLENYENQWHQSGSERIAYYFDVPPGNYVFRVKAASSEGVWAEKSIKIIITPPWWSTWWFYAVCVIAASSVIYILFRYRLNQKLKAYELRNTISRDLHDEVGSTLSSIGFLSSMALEDVNTNKEKANNTLTSINQSANKMLDAMNDIIWNIQPQNDTLENIIVRMISFASELLEAKKINLDFIVADNVKQLKLGLTVRHDFLIIYKEAVNNLAKYSAATIVNICLKYQQPYLILTISDNGKGFDPNAIRYNGNGLKNMQTRAKKIGAVYHLHTSPGNGTSITLQVKPT